MRALAALGRIEELEASILRALPGMPEIEWWGELRVHGYPAAASDLADRTLEWVESGRSNWQPNSLEFYLYGILLSLAGRWDEAKTVFEDMLAVSGRYQQRAARELAYVLANQGHRDQAFRALGQTPFANDLVVRAAVEALLGEKERAMDLLREVGSQPDFQGLHGLARQRQFRSLLDYPPFQDFARPRR